MAERKLATTIGNASLATHMTAKKIDRLTALLYEVFGSPIYGKNITETASEDGSTVASKESLNSLLIGVEIQSARNENNLEALIQALEGQLYTDFPKNEDAGISSGSLYSSRLSSTSKNYLD